MTLVVVRDAKILVVDDEPEILAVLHTSLAAAGHKVRLADDGDGGLRVFREWQPHLLITDLSMPKMGGLALCQAIRNSSNIPIIVLSMNSDEATKVMALELGADDYVTKPFSMNEVLARVQASLRRTQTVPTPATVIAAGDFRIDLDRHNVEIRGSQIYLTPKEFSFLAFMMENADRVVTHKTLLSAVWGKTYSDQMDTVRVLVRQLRKKIEPNPATPTYLKTEPWIGYRFRPGD